jgi:hypothetical protein
MLDEDLHRVHHVHAFSSFAGDFPANFVAKRIRLPAERIGITCGFFESMQRALGFHV